MDSRSKKLLILASKLGYQTRSFAEAAANLGVEVAFATDRCHKLADPWGDGALPLRFGHPSQAADEIALHFQSAPPAAILALGDHPTAAAAYAARALGLSANAPQSVERCRNKLWQREILRDAGLPVPQFFSFARTDPIAPVLLKVKFPCVLKPLTLAASQGVIRADNEEQFRSAVSRIAALLDSPEIRVAHDEDLDRLLVESYISGAEVAVEGLLENGRLRILAIFDKPDPLQGPYFEETIYVTPSRSSAKQQTALRECCTRAVTALGLTHGPIHAEFRVNDRGPWVLEIAPRPIGGLCSLALRFGAHHISLEELLIRDALNLGGTDVERESEASGVMMIPVPRSGIFEGVEGLQSAARIPNISGIEITARVKDYLAAWPEGASYLGFIFARGREPADVEAVLRQAHRQLQFHFSERLPVEHPATGKMPAGGRR